MRHYEIVFMVNPDYSEKVSEIIQLFTNTIKQHKGIIHRIEDWGRRQLSYSIKHLHKAHYVLMNVEASKNAINEINNHLYYNNAIIRNIIIKVKSPITELSPLMKSSQTKEDKIEEKLNIFSKSNEDFN
ncbi:MAG: 30S ribosomal protein S6 [Candidatus Dasytiphilus stammeri]